LGVYEYNYDLTSIRIYPRKKKNVSDSKFEMIGPDMDEIMDGINFINQNYDGSVKLKPMDWSLLVSDNYSIFVKFEPEGDENKHIRFMNDMLSENNFDCKLYKTK
jgi:hypothetical protein